MNPHPDQLLYSDPVDLPVDADLVTPCAAVLDNGLANVANRTAWIAEGGWSSALNWEDGGATTHNLKRAVWSDLDGAFFAVGDGGNDFAEVTYDFGRSWKDLQSSLGSGKVCLDVAIGVGASGLPGQVCIMTSTRAVYLGARSGFATYTFGPAIENALSAAPSGGALGFEPTSALYLAVYRVGATGHRLDSSPNGSSWTSCTLPAGWASYTGSNAPELGCAPGRAVAIFAHLVGAAMHLEIATSTDGATWTGVTIATSAIVEASPRVTRPAFDANTGLWFFCLSATGSDLAEVWTSRNCATWAIAHTFTSKDVEVQGAGVIGPVWAMLTKKGRVLASVDAGASWRWIGAELEGTVGNFGMRAGGGGAVIVNASDKTSFRSTRAGLTAGAIV